MPVFSAADIDFFKTQGYVILASARGPAKTSTLYSPCSTNWSGSRRDVGTNPPHHEGSFIEAYQHQELWNTRQRPRVVEGFPRFTRLAIGLWQASTA